MMLTLKQLKPTQITLLAVNIVTTLVASGLLVWDYLVRLWYSTQYQFFPFLFAGCAYFIWHRWSQYEDKFAVHRLGELTLLIIGAMGFALASMANSPWLAFVSLVIVLVSAFFGLGTRASWDLLPAIAPLALLIRIPSNFDEAIVNVLRDTAITITSAILDLFLITHRVKDKVIDVPNRQLFVDEACSGVNSLFVALALVAVILLATRRRWALAIPLILSVPFWVIVGNVIRLLLVVVLFTSFGLPSDKGLLHEAIGIFTFLFSFFMIWSTDGLLQRIAIVFGQDNTQAEEEFESEAQPLTYAPLWTNTIFPCLVMLIPAGLAISQATTRQALPSISIARWPELGKSALPEKIEDWKLAQYDHKKDSALIGLDVESQQWVYQSNKGVCIASVDSPFSTYHQLQLCYTRVGWTLDSLDQLSLDPATPVPITRAILSEPVLQRKGILHYAILDSNFKHVIQEAQVAPPSGPIERLMFSLRPPTITPCFQVQVFVQMNDEPTPDEISACQRVLKVVLGQLQASPIQPKKG